MQLDDRIIDKTQIYSLVNVECAKQYIGEMGYFVELLELKNLKKEYLGILRCIETRDGYCSVFCRRPNDHSEEWKPYFIPLKNVKPVPIRSEVAKLETRVEELEKIVGKINEQLNFLKGKL